MSKYALRFNIDYLPKPVNAVGRKHWTVKRREIEDIRGFVHQAVKCSLPARPLKRVNLGLTRHSSFEPDPDGLVSSFKAVIDSLVCEGVIENDRSQNFEGGMPKYSWKKAPRGK